MKIITKNKRASFDYEILEKFVAGIVLSGAEVKSIKAGGVKIAGAYIFVNSNSAVVRNMHVSLWEHANDVSRKAHVSDKDRILLLTKKQLAKISSQRKQQKAQIIPVAIGIDKNLVKLEIAVARPLRKYDKKNRRKEREEKRNAQRVAKTVEVVR